MESRRRGAITAAGVLALVLVAVAILVAGTVLGAGSGQESTEIDSCTTISEPGTYELTEDVEDSDADRCLRIETGDVTLDGNGHLVDGTDRDDAYGVYVDADDANSITVRNLAVSDWDEGVRIVDGETDVEDVEAYSNIDGLKARELVDGVRFENVNAHDNADDGIEAIRVTELSVVDSRSANNGGDGIFLNDADDGDVTNNVVEGNGDDGVHGVDPDVMSIDDNEIADNDDDGLFVEARGASGARAEDMSVAGNEITDNGDDGLQLTNVGNRGLFVTENTVCDNDDWQILFENVPSLEMNGNDITC